MLLNVDSGADFETQKFLKKNEMSRPPEVRKQAQNMNSLQLTTR